MNTKLNKLIEILSELKTISTSITPNNIKYIMQKYSIIFAGAKFNTIYSIELKHCINTVFNFPISFEELNSLIPSACNYLNMSFEELIAVEDLEKENPNIQYQITLF